MSNLQFLFCPSYS